MKNIVPFHTIAIEFTSGDVDEYICLESGFGVHPNYLKLVALDNSVRHIETNLIQGIAYEKAHFI